MELDNIIVLHDENGNEIKFEFLDLIEYEQREFVVLLPTDDESGEVVILEVKPCEDDSESESYCIVEEEDTVMAVFEIFKEKFKDVLHFED